MADNYYSEINLHLTWHTKLSRPLITPQIEPMLFGCLREKAASLGDVYIHEIGGTETTCIWPCRSSRPSAFRN